MSSKKVTAKPNNIVYHNTYPEKFQSKKLENGNLFMFNSIFSFVLNLTVLSQYCERSLYFFICALIHCRNVDKFQNTRGQETCRKI